MITQESPKAKKKKYMFISGDPTDPKYCFPFDFGQFVFECVKRLIKMLLNVLHCTLLFFIPIEHTEHTEYQLYPSISVFKTHV
jgi:hypothetical protein